MDHSKPKQRRRWSANYVLDEIKKLENRSAKKIQRSCPALYGAAIRYFGSWKAAVENAGFAYSAAGTRKLPGQWSKNSVIEEIKKLDHRNSGHVRKINPGLYNAALRLFNSWKVAVESAGFDYKKEVKGWTQEDESSFRSWKKNKV